jgi:phosphoribosylanthranilate isomerase
VRRTRVKICGLTRAVDVDAAVRAGADALGFVFTPQSRRCVDTRAARELVRRVPAFVARVGLFMNQDAGEVRRVLAEVPLSLLQFHGGEDGAYCRQFGLPYIKALAMGGAGQLPNVGEYPDAAALLLDSHEPGSTGGTGHAFDWNRIPPLPRPLVLAGGLDPDNVARAVRTVRPWAVDVSSGVEQEPGVKSAAKMQRFIEEASSEISE